MKRLVYIALSAIFMHTGAFALTPQDLRAAELVNLNDALRAVRDGDDSAVTYYVDANLIAPADYKLLIEEADMVVAQKSGLARWPWAWIKMIAGGAAGFIPFYGAIDNFHMYMNPAGQDDINKGKLEKMAKEAQAEVLKAREDHEKVLQEHEPANTAFKVFEDRYNNRYNSGNYNRATGGWNVAADLTWDNYWKLQLEQQERDRIAQRKLEVTQAKEKVVVAKQKVLKSPEKLKDQLAVMRWGTSDLIAYGVGVALCWYVAYNAWQAPYRAYSQAKGVANMLRFYQKQAFQQLAADTNASITASHGNGDPKQSKQL